MVHLQLGGEAMAITIRMTGKHQVTIPKKIAEAMGLKKGSIFYVVLNRNRIELVPVEVKEKVFTEAQYRKLDKLRAAQQGKEKRVTRAFIRELTDEKDWLDGISSLLLAVIWKKL